MRRREKQITVDTRCIPRGLLAESQTHFRASVHIEAVVNKERGHCILWVTLCWVVWRVFMKMNEQLVHRSQMIPYCERRSLLLGILFFFWRAHAEGTSDSFSCYFFFCWGERSIFWDEPVTISSLWTNPVCFVSGLLRIQAIIIHCPSSTCWSSSFCHEYSLKILSFPWTALREESLLLCCRVLPSNTAPCWLKMSIPPEQSC